MTIVVIGASSGPGRLLFDELSARDQSVLGIARQARGISTTGTNARFEALDATDTGALASLVGPGDTVVHCASPGILADFAASRPAFKRLIAIGSTRIYTRYPDEKCRRLTEMSHEIWMGELPATLLHPTMIYGAPGLNNIERVKKFARLSPFIPLPGKGTALIQPVHADDVVRAILACLDDPGTIGKTIAVPGRYPVPYREFIELCIASSGETCRVVSLPYSLISVLALFTRIIPGIPVVTQDEIRRLLEDKNFDADELQSLIGQPPVDIETGLKIAAASLRKQT